MIDESKIREKAYELWERAGGGEGSPESYWHQARALLEAEYGASGADTADTASDDLQSGATPDDEQERPAS